MSSKSPLTYRDAGVDIDAGNALVEKIKPAVAKTMRPEVMGGLGGFGGLFHLGQTYKDPVLVSGTDGVGTKLLLATQHNRLDHIGIDLVAMCVNDILVCGAEPLFFLDYFACGKLEVDQATRVVQGIAAGCEQAGCALIGGETAEMPDMYQPGEFDLAGFAVGAVERETMITGQSVEAGDCLIGVASSGPHSNGYSLIRRVLERDPNAIHETFDGTPLIDALLAPTQIYVKAILGLLKDSDLTVRGMSHITGGGLTENIIRIIPEPLGINIDPTSWPMPSVFGWLMEAGQISETEMRRTFNLGIGFVLVCPQDSADGIIQYMNNEAGLAAWTIGEIENTDANSDRVTYSNG